MAKKQARYLFPGNVLSAIYGKTSIELGMSEKRRDEVIAAAIFTSFHNQEFGTRFKLPVNYYEFDPREDASGVDMVVANENGRSKKLQIKGIYIQRSIERRRRHKTRGSAKIFGRRTFRQAKRDSEELTQMMKGELKKIIQDYSGIYLIINVIADLASQTSLEIAIHKSKTIVSSLKAKEIWFLRHIPVRMLRQTAGKVNYQAYNLIKVAPDKHTYGFSFAF